MTKAIVIAAPHSGSGKTVLTMGLAAALKARGLRVRVAKGGPGFIDPQFISAAVDQPCYNLDKWAMGENQLKARLGQICGDADMLLIEGMMGMFDGAANMNGSTADVAATLDLPVVLVVDASGQAQSIAALVHGFATLRSVPRICGVIANRVGSFGHGELLRDAVMETGIPFLGAVQRSETLNISSRHLGLVQATEHQSRDELIDAARDAISRQVDLEALLDQAGDVQSGGPVKPLPPLGQRIAVAQDIAFGFAYPHLLDDWRSAGAEIEFFSPLADQAPPDACDAIFLPGGYPELHAETIAHARDFMSGLRRAAISGKRIYGECGGYMVLGRTLIDADGQSHAMANLLDHVTDFADRRLHLGYRTLTPLSADLWQTPLRGHEFHYSQLKDAGTDAPLFTATDARGQSRGSVGGQRGSVMGSYMHIIDAQPT